MRFHVAVLASTHLVRQSVAHCLVPVGARVHEFSSAGELIRRLGGLAVDLLVMDIDGMGRDWRAVARAAQLGPQSLPLALLVGGFGFDDAHDALALGVASVILKPFRREEHAVRLYDLVLRKKGVRPRRGEPRFAPPQDLAVRLDYRGGRGSGFSVVDELSAHGLGVAVGPERMAPGASLEEATLALGKTVTDVAARVLHRGLERAGLRVGDWGEGRQRVARLLDELASRAFGSREEKRKW